MAAAYGAPFASNLTGGLLSDVMGGLVPGLSGGLWDSAPQAAQSQPAAAPAPAQSAPADASAVSQQVDQDQIARLIAQNRPNKLQTLLHAWGTGQDYNTAAADLTERNIKNRMLPARIAADFRDAQINAALADKELGALQGGQGGGMPAASPVAAPGMAPNGGATTGLQTASAAGVPSAPAAGAGMPFSRDMLQIMALRGVPGAAAAYQIGTPKWAIDRGTHTMYDETTGALGRRIPSKEYVNNYLVDPNADDAPSYIPKLPEGTMPDGKGGVISIPGFIAAQAGAAGATEAAKQAAAGPYDTVTINVDGVPTVVSKSQLAQMQGIVPGFAGGAIPPQQGSGPSPAAASAPQGGGKSIPAQQAMQFYIAKGYKPEQAAGIVGNLIGESGLDASRTADDGSFGLAQWTGPRLQGLFAFAKANKLDPSDPNTQLEYSHYEMTHGEKAAGDAIRGAGDVDDATAAAVGYERPAGYTPQNPQGASGFSQRLGAARQLVGGAGGATTQPAPANKPFIAQGVNEATQKTDQEAIADLRKEVEEKRYLAGKANEFVQTMGDMGTGPVYGGIGPFHPAELAADVSAPFNPSWAAKLDKLKSIQNQAWVHLRPQGSGPIRGYEAGDFKQSFPNIENLGTANDDITKRMNADLSQSEQELTFKEKWLQDHGSLAGADAAWAKQPIAHNAMAGQDQPQAPQRKPAPKLPPRAPALPQRTPPAAAIADLKRDPSPQARQEFDQVFGPGSAKRVLGGA